MIQCIKYNKLSRYTFFISIFSHINISNCTKLHNFTHFGPLKKKTEVGFFLLELSSIFSYILFFILLFNMLGFTGSSGTNILFRKSKKLVCNLCVCKRKSVK